MLFWCQYDELDESPYPSMAKLVFVLFQILIPILLLNMLIAMMGNTYAIVSEKSEKEFLKQWARVIMSIERAVSVDKAKGGTILTYMNFGTSTPLSAVVS